MMGQPLKSINPATGLVIRDYQEDSSKDLARKIAGASSVFNSWKAVPVPERVTLLLNLADLLLRETAVLGQIMTAEMGKPIVQSEMEIEKCANCCRYYAENANELLSPQYVDTEARQSYVTFEPLGVVLAVMPWNFPFWQLFRFAAPSILAGNVCLLKHASNVQGCAAAIEQLFERAGFPEGVMTNLVVSSARVAAIIASPEIKAVTLTGSEGAGRAIAAEAGKHLKRVVLELGGSDPFLVLADADARSAAGKALEARIINSGQSCIAAKRFIVEASIAERFADTLAEQSAKLVVGDPLDRVTQVGPLAREDLVDVLERQVDSSIRRGAKLIAGGSRLNRTGYFYAPTVLMDVTPDMEVFSEETFGPVAAITIAHSRKELIELANRTPFGLGASIWTSSIVDAEAIIPQLEVGMVFVNAIVKSDPRLPFGGIKTSGYGRELSVYGIREFVNIKTIWIANA